MLKRIRCDLMKVFTHDLSHSLLLVVLVSVPDEFEADGLPDDREGSSTT